MTATKQLTSQICDQGDRLVRLRRSSKSFIFHDKISVEDYHPFKIRVEMTEFMNELREGFSESVL